MSTLLDKCNELRTLAAMLVVRDLPEVASLVSESADIIWQLRDDLQQAQAENAKLRKLLKYNGAVIEACTSEILDHIGVPYIVGPAGVAQALMEATAMLVHKRYDFDQPSFYKDDK